MRKDITIGAEVRSARGKNESRRLRAAGQIPAVIYGAGHEATAVSLDPREINRILFSDTGHNSIFNVSVGDNGAMPAMIVDWQHDPVKDTLLHVDMVWIDLEKKIKVNIPIQTHGEPQGVKMQGGVLDVVHRDVEITCLPSDIPAQFNVDVTALMIGDTIRAKDLPLGDEISLESKPELVICHVVAPRGLETAEEEEEEAVEEGAEEAEESAPAEEEKD